jgi:hypothetical protein
VGLIVGEQVGIGAISDGALLGGRVGRNVGDNEGVNVGKLVGMEDVVGLLVG